MLIALIDDGIQVERYPDIRVTQDLTVGEDGMIQKRATKDAVLTDHGTTCARIISKYAPEAEFCSLRVFQGEQLNTSCDRLVAAMEWCWVQRIPLIHMSLGSDQPSDFPRIRSLVAKMVHEGQVIVAACSNRERYSVPACLSGVIGVLEEEGLVDDQYAVAPIRPGNVLIHASSRHTLDRPGGHADETPVVNSYAAPTVTAKVHNLLVQSGPQSVAQVYRTLTSQEQWMHPDFIHKAVIWNPGDLPILRQHLFFQCVGAYKELEELMASPSGLEQVAYIAPPDHSAANTTGELLLSHLPQMKGVLYGGMLPKDVNPKKNNTLMWSEDACQYPVYGLNSLNQERIPWIDIDGVGLQAVDLMCQLRDLFAQDGYHCRCLSDHPSVYLYDVEFVPGHVPAQRAMAYVQHHFQPDVMLTCFQQDRHKMKDIEDTFSIVLDQDGREAKSTVTKERRYLLPNVSERDVICLYHQIVDFFS